MVSTAVGASGAKASAILPRWIGKGGRGVGGKCFLVGTRIRTPKGEVPVESLAVGDVVETISGQAKPITWIGHRRFERQANERWPVEILPVRIARSALGPEIPHSDLYLSDAHALYLDGLLIPVRQLINGRSIARCAVDSDIIEYFHIEVAGHDVIFAEGAPAETLRGRSKLDFDNASDRVATSSVTPFAAVAACRTRDVLRSRLRTALSPIIDRRQPVDLVWERLAERAERHMAA
ncbi:MAG TPA: Hint domain-containing protein [Hyphomicrobiaceae bacterium]|nr:Hint domain-containing protein [Hyphomicrobiaceae bacterium]